MSVNTFSKRTEIDLRSIQLRSILVWTAPKSSTFVWVVSKQSIYQPKGFARSDFAFYIGSTPTISYLDLYLNTAYAAHQPFYISICIWTLPTQHTTFYVSLWRRAYAHNVRLRFLYRQYTNLFIFRFVSQHCLRSTLRVLCDLCRLVTVGYKRKIHFCIPHFKYTQFVNEMCSQRACSTSVDKLWHCCCFMKLLQACCQPGGTPVTCTRDIRLVGTICNKSDEIVNLVTQNFNNFIYIFLKLIINSWGKHKGKS